MGACCFCACIFKMILGILNMILLLIGVLIAGSGGILLTLSNSDFVKNIVKIIVAPVLEKLYNNEAISTTASGDFKEFVGPISWALIIIGSIIIAIAIFGYIGLNINIHICLVIYACLIVVMIIIEILLVSLFFSGALNKPIEHLMVKSIESEYGEFDESNVVSLSWNLMMLKLNCCGATGYKDFHGNLQKTSKWPKSVKQKIGGIDYDMTFDMPIFCCKTSDFPNLNFTDVHCVQDSSSNNNKDQGCRESIWKELEGVRNQFLTLGVFAVLVQVAILAMVCVVMQESKVFPEN